VDVSELKIEDGIVLVVLDVGLDLSPGIWHIRL